MSRLTRYRESVSKFIKDRSCLFNEDLNRDVSTVIKSYVEKSDILLPILFLTVMNSQNKKNKVTMQGYYAASAIQFLFILTLIDDAKDEIVIKYGYDVYDMIKLHILISANKSLFQNIEILKNSVNKDQCVDITNSVFEIYHELVNSKTVLSSINLVRGLKFKDHTVNDEVSKWYVKDDQQLKAIVEKTPCLTRESFNDALSCKLASVVELTMCCSWLIGGGDRSELGIIRKISGYFTQMYKLYVDFINLKDDIRRSIKGYSLNYVVNYGLQDSYELFMYNKQKFIEECMIHDVFTNTVKEIVSLIETHVDEVVDETSPDLKSNFSFS